EVEDQDFQRSIALLEPQVSRFPEDTEYRSSLARSLVNRCGALTSLGRTEEAERVIRRAVTSLEELTRTNSPDPRWLRGLASAYANLADTLMRTGRETESADYRRKGISIYERLARGSTNLPDYQHDLTPFDWGNFAGCYRDLGKYLGHIGNTEQASEALA